MRSDEKLRAVRTKVPNCSLVAFIDLSTEMVLAQDAENTIPQERLNELAATAVDVFEGVDAATIAEVLGWSAPVREASFHNESGLSHFLRGDDGEALCCLGKKTALLSELTNTAQKALKGLSHADD